MKQELENKSGFAKSIHPSKKLEKSEIKKEVKNLIKSNIRALKYLEDK